MKNKYPLVSIVIPAFNEEKSISKTLKNITKSKYPEKNIRIIVVDNNSQDKTKEIAEKFPVEIISLEKGNVGAVRNFGARHSTTDIIIFLDADCIVDELWVARGVDLLKNSIKTVFGGAYKTQENSNWVERLWLLDNPKHPRTQKDLLGGCIFVKKEDFQSVGGFNEEITSGEDSDFSKRLKDNGYTVKILPELSVIHLGNPKTIINFTKRQIWHSENYLKSIKRSIKDHTFLITVAFVITHIAIPFSLTIDKSYKTAVLLIFFAIALTVSMSAKRIILTKYRPRNLIEIAGIILLDYIYLIGRSLGILKSSTRSIRDILITNN